LQCAFVQQTDIGAKTLLQRVILTQRRPARGRGEKQIAAFVQIDRRFRAVDFEPLADRAQKLDSE
jgi:hypothetical protein